MLATSGRQNHVPYRSEERIAFAGQRVGNERRWRGAYTSAVSARIPEFWHSAARYLFAFALRYRRPGTFSVFVGRPPPARRTRVVADLAAWAHRLWKFAVPVTVF